VGSTSFECRQFLLRGFPQLALVNAEKYVNAVPFSFPLCCHIKQRILTGRNG
jgi:hypothetical protein